MAAARLYRSGLGSALTCALSPQVCPSSQCGRSWGHTVRTSSPPTCLGLQRHLPEAFFCRAVETGLARATIGKGVACSAILPATPDLTKSPRRFPPPWTVKETSRPCVGDAYPSNRPRVRKSEVKVHVVGSSLWAINSSTNSFAATSKPSKAVTRGCHPILLALRIGRPTTVYTRSVSIDTWTSASRVPAFSGCGLWYPRYPRFVS